MSWFSNLIGDVTNAVETVVPGAKQIDQFLNKAGVGPQELAHPFQSPQGWAGDIEHGFSQATHNPYVRDAAEIAAAVALAEFGGPEIMAALQGGGEAVSAADMAAMSADASATLDATAAETMAANSAAIAGETAVPGAAATAAAAPAAAATAADASAAVPGAMQEITVNAPRIAAQGGGLDPATLFAAANPAVNPLTYTGGAQPGVRPSLKSAMDVQIADPTGGGGPLLQGADQAVPGANPSFGPMGSEEGGDLSVGTDQGMQPTTDPTKGFWGKMADTLKTPKGALTAAGLGLNLYGLMNRAQLSGYAKQAGGAAGPATAQAQAMISAGGMAGPLWQQQKAGIDAQINQQLQDFSRAIQQNAINSGQGGANSDVVQQQIAQKRTELEAQRQAMYVQAAQANVTNAVAELTGGNQTLMALAQLQFQQDQAAQQLAQAGGNIVGKLATLWPDTSTTTPATPG